MINRKGGGEILSIWWIVVLALVFGVTVAGVVTFYSNQLDARLNEAQILSENTYLCLTESGSLDESFLTDSFDIFTRCNFNEKLFASGSKYYLKVNLVRNDQVVRTYEYGDKAIKDDCDIVLAGNAKAQNYPKCVLSKRNVNFYSPTFMEGQLQILSASNQYGVRVK